MSQRNYLVRVIVVSASEDIFRTTRELLADEHTTVEQRELLAALREATAPDLVLLDGRILSDACRDIRRLRLRWMKTAIMVSHALGISDVIALMDAGADDVTTCGDFTFVSRLHALARRQRVARSGVRREIGDLRYDHDDRTLLCIGMVVSLTAIEHALVGCLFESAPRAASTKSLQRSAWGAFDKRDRGVALRVYIGYLRRKIHASRRARIESVHGIGYRVTCQNADRAIEHETITNCKKPFTTPRAR